MLRRSRIIRCPKILHVTAQLDLLKTRAAERRSEIGLPNNVSESRFDNRSLTKMADKLFDSATTCELASDKFKQAVESPKDIPADVLESLECFLKLLANIKCRRCSVHLREYKTKYIFVQGEESEHFE